MSENPPAFSVVCATLSPTEADMMIATLRGAGLHPVDLDTTVHFSSLAGAFVMFQIQVPTSELEEASGLLEAYDTPAQDA